MDDLMSTEEDLTALETLKGDEKIVEQAKQRFQQCMDWEREQQTRFTADLKFANADPDNGWQWPGYLWSTRQDDATGYKPRLTINKVRQHNLLIKNNAKQNTPAIKISPVGEKASFKAAQAWAGLVKHIERQSKAKNAYDTATSFQVDAGLGYIRLVTDYADDDSFDQELFIRRVRNPLNVYMDPDANELDKSDSRFAFVFEDAPLDEFLREHPKMRGHIAETIALNNPNMGMWLSKDHVRTVEYFARTMRKDRLVLMKAPADIDSDGKPIIARWSKIPKEIRERIEENDSIIKEREIFEHEIRCYKIAADKVLDDQIWPGRYIPIVPVLGEETVIDNKLDRKGHTRNMKDAQRMYNFWTSSAVEQVALQTKTKWFVPVGATENLESYYRLINVQNYPYIPYNSMDSEGNKLDPPTPIEPPQMAEGFVKGMMIARDELGMSSGQNDENFGKETNAISGRAIGKRQEPGNVTTYHFMDGLATALVQVANIILDVAPHIYDTKQIKRILAEDGSESLIEIDPNADAAYSETSKDAKEGEVSAIFNPKIGRYWVTADVGPGYETRRKEAWDAFVQITTQNAELVSSIGDLMFRYADFPGADEISERLRRLVPANVLGEGPSPDLQAAQQANEELKKLIAELTQKLADQKLKLDNKEEHHEVEVFRAESDRLKQVDNAGNNIDEATLRPLLEQIIRDMMGPGGSLAGGEGSRRGEEGSEATDAAPDSTPGAGGASEPPVAGALQAPDGHHYVPHPEGGFARVQQTP